ncbi:hypothetical protein FQN57_002583 [Myotisia sp. PD_48]|nr:hypothetical protein FQN57_002583 [Myotisia sp. PD_48]
MATKSASSQSHIPAFFGTLSDEAGTSCTVSTPSTSGSSTPEQSQIPPSAPSHLTRSIFINSTGNSSGPQPINAEFTSEIGRHDMLGSVRSDELSTSPKNIPLPPSVPSVASSPFPSTPNCASQFDFIGTENTIRNPFIFTGSQTGTPESNPSQHRRYMVPSFIQSEPSMRSGRTENSSFIASTASSPTPLGQTNRPPLSTKSMGESSLINNFAQFRLHTDPSPPRGSQLGENSSYFHVGSAEGPNPKEEYHYSAVNNELLSADCLDSILRDRLKSGIGVAQSIAKVIQRSEIGLNLDPRLATILRAAKELSNFCAQPERKIGVVGNTGAGKSSLINALLDEYGLAKTAGNGRAVTSFVTEYRYPRDEHISDRALEIEYLHGADLDQELIQLLADYREPFAPHCSRKDIPAEEYAELERKSDSAKISLTQAFSMHVDWDIEKLKGFESDSYEQALTCLRRWARLIEWPEGVHEGRYSATAKDIQHQKILIDRCVSNSIWAFIKIVRVYVKSQVLKNGLVLADLPGFGDINYARVQAARRYISRCDEIFIVSGIARVIDDKNIYDILREHIVGPRVGERAASLNANIICTRAANFNRGDREEWLAKVNQSDLRQAENQKRAAKSGKWVHASDMEKAEINHLRLFVKARNHQIEAELRANHETSGINLNIFFTDIDHYFEPVNELEVEISGIAKLRKFCYRIRASAVEAAVNNFLNNSLPGLIHSLELWSEAATQPGVQLLRSQVDTTALQKSMASVEQEWRESISQLIENTISKSYCPNRRVIETAGLRACESWNTFHGHSYAAWCRHNGTHETKTQPYRCWNSELIEKMTKTMKASWEILYHEADDSFDLWSQTMGGVIDEINTKTKGKPQNLSASDSANAPKALTYLLQARKRIVKAKIEDARGDYLALFGLPVFLGPGVFKRRSSRIHDHVKSGNIYNNIHRDIKSKLEEITENTSLELASEMEAIREQIDTDLATVEVVDDSLMKEDPTLFDELAHVLPWARSFVDQQVRS